MFCFCLKIPFPWFRKIDYGTSEKYLLSLFWFPQINRIWVSGKKDCTSKNGWVIAWKYSDESRLNYRWVEFETSPLVITCVLLFHIWSINKRMHLLLQKITEMYVLCRGRRKMYILCMFHKNLLHNVRLCVVLIFLKWGLWYPRSILSGPWIQIMNNFKPSRLIR